mgnify:CR=1 FL=1
MSAGQTIYLYLEGYKLKRSRSAGPKVNLFVYLYSEEIKLENSRSAGLKGQPFTGI